MSRWQLPGPFVPYIWLGGAERGVCWFAENDRDWSLDPKRPTLEIHRQGETTSLVVRFVTKPVTWTRPHRIKFGLMATPAKPMPERRELPTLVARGRRQKDGLAGVAINPNLSMGGRVHVTAWSQTAQPRTSCRWISNVGRFGSRLQSQSGSAKPTDASFSEPPRPECMAPTDRAGPWSSSDERVPNFPYRHSSSTPAVGPIRHQSLTVVIPVYLAVLEFDPPSVMTQQIGHRDISHASLVFIGITSCIASTRLSVS